VLYVQVPIAFMRWSSKNNPFLLNEGLFLNHTIPSHTSALRRNMEIRPSTSSAVGPAFHPLLLWCRDEADNSLVLQVKSLGGSDGALRSRTNAMEYVQAQTRGVKGLLYSKLSVA